MAIRPVPPQAKTLGKSFEKCVLVCYDTDGAREPTIGWGHTRGLTRADVGVRRITQQQADQLCDADYDVAAQSLEDQIGRPAVDAMTDNQYSAMVDFVFNEGTIGTGLRAILRARRFDQVPAKLMEYVYAHLNGQDKPAVKELGLVRRRSAEVELWSTGEPGTVEAHVPSGSLQTMATPPAPAPVTVVQRPVVFASAAASPALVMLVAAPGELNQVAQWIQGLLEQTAGLDGNVHVHQVRALLVGAVGLITAITPLAIWASTMARSWESRGVPNNVAQPVATPADPPAQAQLPLG